MGFYTNDVYNQPERFGLELLGEFDVREPDYSFDIFAVWINRETRDLYFAVDSGRSCPSPFELFDSVESLTHASKSEVIAAILSGLDDGDKADERSAHNLIARVMGA
jgi:hypothetical protein